MAEEVGVDIVFAPKDEDMYPEGYQTFVEVTELTRSLEGFYRPRTFSGCDHSRGETFQHRPAPQSLFRRKRLPATEGRPKDGSGLELPR